MKRSDWYSLAAVPSIGFVKIQKLLREFGGDIPFFSLSKEELVQKGGLSEKDADDIFRMRPVLAQQAEDFARMEESGTHFLLYNEPGYPERLQSIPDPPFFLFVRGELPPDNRLTVGMIGARQCTDYGINLALDWSQTLAQEGCWIISGMADGIDGASHRGALSAGDGRTCAVLGCSLEICYPKKNRDIYERIPENGALISEFFPGTSPKAMNFPRRNRLISAFSDLLCVMEAREKSGTLITVGYALEQGKDIYALPGRIDDPLSAGCLQLIRDGAQILLSPQDILSAFDRYPGKLRRVGRKRESGKLTLNEEEETVLSCLSKRPLSIDDLLIRSRLSYPALCGALLALELKGAALRTAGGLYSIGLAGKSFDRPSSSPHARHS